MKMLTRLENTQNLLVGPPRFTIRRGFDNGASSDCQELAAALNIDASAWCKAPTVSTCENIQ